MGFCIAALKEALSKGQPEIFNTDQGGQFTSEAFCGLLLERGIKVSMDGKGRYLDNCQRRVNLVHFRRIRFEPPLSFHSCFLRCFVKGGGITCQRGGDKIAKFLADTMRGETPGVKVCHRMEAAKHLIKYGFPDAVCDTTPDRHSRAGGKVDSHFKCNSCLESISAGV